MFFYLKHSVIHKHDAKAQKIDKSVDKLEIAI